MERSISNKTITQTEKLRFKDSLRIFATNEACASYNLKKLLELKEHIATIQAQHQPTTANNASAEQAARLSATLHLCVGAKVI